MRTHTARELSRLTEADEATMRRAIGAAVNDWRPRPARFTIEHRETLMRVALHAIGCTRDDMRNCELFEVAAMLGSFELVGDDHTGRVRPWSTSDAWPT